MLRRLWAPHGMVSHGLQLQSLWVIPAAAVSSHGVLCRSSQDSFAESHLLELLGRRRWLRPYRRPTWSEGAYSLQPTACSLQPQPTAYSLQSSHSLQLQPRIIPGVAVS